MTFKWEYIPGDGHIGSGLSPVGAIKTGKQCDVSKKLKALTLNTYNFQTFNSILDKTNRTAWKT